LGQRVRKVTVADLNFGKHTLQIQGNGSIESRHSLNMVTLVGGQVVYSRENLKSGLFVKAGDILLKIDDREASNMAQQTRSGLINAIVSLIPDLKGGSNNDVHLKWSNYLERLNMSSTPDLPEISDSQERIRVSMHNIFNQFSQVRNAEINLERHTIRAPFDAYLVSDGAIEGTWMTPGQAVASLIDPFNLEIAVPLTIDELNLLSESENPIAIVYSTEDHQKSLSGVLRRQNAHIDRSSQTVTIHVELTNSSLDPAFLPGNYMDVSIEGIHLLDVDLLARDIVVPGPAIYTMEDSILAKHPVEIVATQGDSVVIRRGNLNSGDLVITTTLQSPMVGMRIAVSEPKDDTDTAIVSL
ncbi:efflux RND transporter periplasmic adaptor subunit, partial [bacterium]|nr:efflux RND transporter periplasmic adaptor subunit [bacterium]